MTAKEAIGEQKQWPKEFWDEFLRLRKQEEVNATIERCAQVVKEILDRTYDATAKERLEASIAAIRALKK